MIPMKMAFAFMIAICYAGTGNPYDDLTDGTQFYPSYFCEYLHILNGEIKYGEKLVIQNIYIFWMMKLRFESSNVATPKNRGVGVATLNANANANALPSSLEAWCLVITQSCDMSVTLSDFIRIRI